MALECFQRGGAGTYPSRLQLYIVGFNKYTLIDRLARHLSAERR